MIAYVSESDLHPESKKATALHDAVKQLCTGFEGAGIWERIQAKYHLGVIGPQWATNMNSAISDWNQHLPKTCSEVRAAFAI